MAVRTHPTIAAYSHSISAVAPGAHIKLPHRGLATAYANASLAMPASGGSTGTNNCWVNVNGVWKAATLSA